MFIGKMAFTSRLTTDRIARYCAGDELSDHELEAELDQIGVESNEEDLNTGFCDDSDDNIVQNLLNGAYSQVAAVTSTPAERDSLLYLDPDMSKLSSS